MIALASPITISPAPVNGKPVKSATLNQIDWTVSYDNNSATAFLLGVNVPLLLWGQNTTPTYTAAGQFTDTDVQNRVTQLLGSTPTEIQNSILALFPQPSSPKVAAQPAPVAKPAVKATTAKS